MDLAGTDIRYGSGGMTVNAQGHATHRMLRGARAAMLMAVEVTAMTG